MEYRIDDRQLDAVTFITFVNKVWPGKYDEGRTAEALFQTLNITAYDGETLVGCLRILTDGYFGLLNDSFIPSLKSNTILVLSGTVLENEDMRRIGKIARLE